MLVYLLESRIIYASSGIVIGTGVEDSLSELSRLLEAVETCLMEEGSWSRRQARK